MEREAHLPGTVIRWADELQARGLGDLALMLVTLLEVWGFIGGQVLWMLSPLIGQAAVTPIAEVLESPEDLALLRKRLIDGATEGE